MKLGVMQPYFLPYIGYWQLIHAVDVFILADDVQYIKKGWINRNRFLQQGGGWHYVILPLQKYSMHELIKNIKLHSSINLYALLLHGLEQYRFKKRAPYFAETVEFLKDILAEIHTRDLAIINAILINKICQYLDINTPILISSDCHFDLPNLQEMNDRPIRIAGHLQATEFINPINGAHLYNRDKFVANTIQLSFLQSHDIHYEQGVKFEPLLSIVDVLMFNGQQGTKALLNEYTIIKPSLLNRS